MHEKIRKVNRFLLWKYDHRSFQGNLVGVEIWFQVLKNIKIVSRFFLGKNKIMQVALGKNEES